jgi:histidinol phosphatase-like PHP family hydrolase
LPGWDLESPTTEEKESMKAPRYDFHIHTKYLGCANETMEVPEIVKVCERLGVATLGITDHLNTLDKLELHVPIRDDLLAVETEVEVYFGVELNFLGCDDEFAYNPEVQEELGFQFAIGGIHGTYLKEYDLAKLVEIQHRHHLKTCEDPLVQVLVHPYWFGKGEFDRNGWPWFDSMKVVPESCVRELAHASRETGTAIEINGGANLKSSAYSEDYVKEYFDYLSLLAEEGAMFSLGSDAHDINRLAVIEDVWAGAEQLGLSHEQIWRPEGEPFIGGRG